MSPILGIWASQNYPRSTTAYESIATVIVGSGGSSAITFSSIPSTFTHLQLRLIGRTDYGTTGPTNMFIQLNGDTGSNYTTHNVRGNGSSAAATGDANIPFGYMQDAFPTAGNTASVFGAAIFDILDYTNTNKYKTIRNLYGVDINGSGTVGLAGYLWQNTAAINSITFAPTVGGTNLVQYSHAALYGIKGA
jgi:hypothetical protein